MKEIIEYLPIRVWSEADRPREKLMRSGSQALSDAELLAILIGSGSRNESAVDLCKRILHTAGNDLNRLGKLTVADLKKFKGMGEAKAISIMAALELGRRRGSAEIAQEPKITSSRDAYQILSPVLLDLPHEEFWILLLNRANRVIQRTCIGKGGISGTVADPRLILRHGIEQLASGIILAHNHPSGNLSPSNQDFDLTKKVKEGAKIMDIQVLDHLIIAGNSYYSFADEGTL